MPHFICHSSEGAQRSRRREAAQVHWLGLGHINTTSAQIFSVGNGFSCFLSYSYYFQPSSRGIKIGKRKSRENSNHLRTGVRSTKAVATSLIHFWGSSSSTLREIGEPQRLCHNFASNIHPSSTISNAATLHWGTSYLKPRNSRLRRETITWIWLPHPNFGQSFTLANLMPDTGERIPNSLSYLTESNLLVEIFETRDYF